MNMIPDVRTRSILVVAGVLAAGCARDPVQPTDTSDPTGQAEEARSAPDDDTAEILVGERVRFPDLHLAVTYQRLEHDSRCPDGVTCVWEGDAAVRIVVEVEDAAGPTVETTLHTTLEPRAITVADVSVELLDVLPRPVHGEVTDPGETRIVVRVKAL